MTRSFCVFILSHGRPDTVLTVKALNRFGYTGDWKIVVDDEDPTVPQYIHNFGDDRVIVFSKKEWAKHTDVGDNLPGRKTAVFARNACFTFARERGYTHFLELDDDYKDFQLRGERDGILTARYPQSLDDVFATMLDFLDDTGATSVAVAQGGDFIGGVQSQKWQQKILRKAMNTFFFRTDHPVTFAGRMNDDVSTYVTLSTRGHLFFTLTYCMVYQLRTQEMDGGMSEEYKALGTYVKSFYSVMMCPSAVKVSMMSGESMQRRAHHVVDWRRCAPKILSQAYQKGDRAR